MPLAVGARLGQYEIVAPLGVGGMGEVYRAHDSRLHRFVAVKCLSNEVTRSWWVMWTRIDPRVEPLRADPRYQRLLSKLGLSI
jgi:serine/threonine protein kinase